jgi:hypothetical protein
VGDEGDDRELHEKGGRDEPREQPQHDHYRADGLEKEHHISRGQRRLDSAPAMLPAANASMVAVMPFSPSA